MDTDTSEHIIYAGFWRRVEAFLIDAVFVASFQIVMGSLLSGYGQQGRWFVMALAFLYFPVFECTPLQGTFGKLALGLKITNFEHHRISFFRAFIRNLSKIFSVITVGFGFILAGFPERKQALHDMIAGALVVKVDRSQISPLFVWMGRLLFFIFISAFIFGTGFLISVIVRNPEIPSRIKEIFTPLMKKIPVFQKPVVSPAANSPSEISSVKKKPLQFSEASYDSLLIMPAALFDGGLKTSSGAVSLQLSPDTWTTGSLQNQLLLKVRLPKLPNLDILGDKAGRLAITHVWNKKNQELLNPLDPLETSRQPIKFSSLVLPVPMLEASRKVQLISSVTESDIKGVEGRLSLYLPIDIETLSLETKYAGQPTEKAGVTVTIEQASFGQLRIRYRGDVGRLIAAYGYNTSGQDLSMMEWSRESFNDGAVITYGFQGRAASVSVMVASHMATRDYAFVIGERGPVAQSISSHKKTTTHTKIKKSTSSKGKTKVGKAKKHKKKKYPA